MFSSSRHLVPHSLWPPVLETLPLCAPFFVHQMPGPPGASPVRLHLPFPGTYWMAASLETHNKVGVTELSCKLFSTSARVL